MASMTENIAQTTGAQKLLRIAEAADRLPPVRDYFRGHSAALGLPREVLSFLRRHDLHGEAAQLHRRFVLIAALDGTGGVIVDGQLHQLAPGQLLLIFPHQSHHYTRFGHLPAWLFITFEVDRAAVLEPLRHRVVNLDDAAVSELAAVVDLLGGSHAGRAAPRLLILLDQLRGQAPARAPAAPGDRVADCLTQVAAYVHAHVEEPLDAETVADAVALSPSYLRATFRQHVGVPLGRYIRNVRIHRACHLLREEGHTVSEAATQLGFSSVFAFSRTFKQVMRCAPREYRRT